jgi:hypothetical protein
LYTIKAIILLDNEGKRLLAKYYAPEWSNLKDQKSFEKTLFEKTRKSNNEITIVDNYTIVYYNNLDVFIYLVGSGDENELLLFRALNTFREALNEALK